MQNTAHRAKVAVSDGGRGIVSHVGALLLTETARVTGLRSGLSAELGRWRPSRAVHDPGKTVLDLAVAVALGGDCLADVSVLRAEAALFGRWRLIRWSPAWSRGWPRTRRQRWLR
jgi:Transposase DDE domain group 1